MGKLLQKIEDTIVSLGIALPMVGGAAVGLLSVGIGQTPVHALEQGQYEYAADELLCNYTFYNSSTRKFSLSNGAGVKGLIAGTAITKILKAIRDS